MRLFLTLLTAWLISGHALANPVQRPHIEVELIPASMAVTPGEPFTVALRMTMEDRWHTYWRNPGDSGLPTTIQWTLPEGFEAGPILWPVPERIDIGPLANYGYKNEVLLITDIRTPDSIRGLLVPIKARADWLVCEEICIPGDAELSIMLPVGPSSPNPLWANAIEATRDGLPRELPGLDAAATLAGDEWLISIAREAVPRLGKLEFFPHDDGWIRYASPQRLVTVGDRHQIRFDAAPGARDLEGELAGVLVARPAFSAGVPGATVAMAFDTAAALPPAPVSTPAGNVTLLAALALAFVGGIILNLMPCVFPIVSIKLLGFVQQSGGNNASLRAHGLVFAAGVVVCFWAVAGVLLGLRAGGEALGWGYQLQSPLVVSALAILFFALALNLSGVFHFGDSMQQLAGSVRARSGYLDAFLAGLLATVVATPCTAPFMGVALGFALTQPASDAMLVFTFLALGMASPYILLSFSPALMRRLPKPGAWMDTFRRILAFPLYLTVVWLAWVLGRQVGVDGVAKLLVALTLFGAALWVYGHWRHSPSARARYAAVLMSALLAAGGVLAAWPASEARDPVAYEYPSSDAWKQWSPGAVEAAQSEGKAVFVDFTAAWCVTCQVNKQLVLNRGAVLRRFAEADVQLLRADWTNQDPEITEALRLLGRSGVPVYAMYPADGGAPELLPELLTESRVMEAIERATGGGARTAAR
ncbi:MAG: thioredoxin family protein [Burkholderiales bacterium]